MRFIITAAEQTRRELAALNHKPPAEVQRATITVEQKVAQLRIEFGEALSNVASQRKKIYAILVDLKEHFQEYGFKSPRAAVEGVCQRSKTWANDFMAQIESEAEISQVTEFPVGVADKTGKKEQKALSQVEQAREEEPEKPRVKTARESMADAAYAEREEAKQVPLECPKCLGSGWIGVKPKEVSEPCKCGCVLTVVVCQILAEHGVPSVGLRVGEAGLIMGKIKANNWKLPKSWEWVKSPGEWKERQWRK